jgi:hypothetical protein
MWHLLEAQGTEKVFCWGSHVFFALIRKEKSLAIQEEFSYRFWVSMLSSAMTSKSLPIKSVRIGTAVIQPEKETKWSPT